MYNAEVLSKFPVVQHFPFGSLFSWERDPNALPPPPTAHGSSGPQARPQGPAAPAPTTQVPGAGTKAPWASASQSVPQNGTAAPWAASRGPGGPSAPRMPPVLPNTSTFPPGPMAPVRAPWASSQPPAAPTGSAEADVVTKAPWAK